MVYNKWHLWKQVYFVLFITVIIPVLASCVNTRKAVYFNDISDTTLISSLPIPESLIQANDILGITVSSLNPEASLIFNAPASQASSNASGYLVNSDGYIQLPVIGNVKAAGLSKEQLKQSISKTLVDKKLLVDPVVSIRFLNFRVTVLGEVKSPMVIPVAGEKISLLEAIGFAGDLTIYAKRNNVLVIREENGEKTIKRLNLNSSELFNSPYYYLKSNDIVYVEPNKAKVANAGRGQVWIPAIFSALSFVAIIVDRAMK